MIILFECVRRGKCVINNIIECCSEQFVYDDERPRRRPARECGGRRARSPRPSPPRRAGATSKPTNGAHGAELGELSGLLHAGLVKREPEDLSRKVPDDEHARAPPRHKVRHTAVRRRRARTHYTRPLEAITCLFRARRATCSRPPAPSPRPSLRAPCIDSGFPTFVSLS